MSSYDTIVRILHEFAERSKTQALTLGEAMDTLDEAAYAFISLILVLPFMQPVPLGPLTVLGGLTFVALGMQLWRGHESPVLPRKVRNVAMKERNWRILITVCLKIVGFCRKFTRPRYTSLVTGRRGQQYGAIILVGAGALMSIPFGVLPLNNVLPGLAVIFYCFGQLEEDGLMVMIAFFWLTFTTIYFGLFFFGLWYYGSAVISRWLA